MTDRAKAAYAAYGESVHWKNFRGEPMPQFSELPEAIQCAWDSACEGALQHWLENEFRDACNDHEKVWRHAAVFNVGLASGDTPVASLSKAIASFVVALIAPAVLKS